MSAIEKYISEYQDLGRKIQFDATYKTLIQVDKVINYYQNNHEIEHDAVVIDIYGLLQNLFVGIDSLYSLSIGITNNKFYINVNQNKTLNGLKHIRNDIVGHPTNRKYGENGVGYSLINLDELTYFQFKYKTYIYQRNTFEVNETVVDLVKLMQEYLHEKAIIMKRLDDFLTFGHSNIGLENVITTLLNSPIKTNLNQVESEFIKAYGNLGNHRFMWRLSLINTLMDWKTDDAEINDLLVYILKDQIVKLLEINNAMSGANSRLIRFKIPYLLKRFYKYLDKHPLITEYIKNLHDSSNPFYLSDLNYLIMNISDLKAQKVLAFLRQQTESNKVYLIGSTIKKYKK